MRIRNQIIYESFSALIKHNAGKRFMSPTSFSKMLNYNFLFCLTGSASIKRHLAFVNTDDGIWESGAFAEMYSYS